MNRINLLLSLLLPALFLQAQQPVDYVNTLVGSDSKYELSAGNTYPAVAMPWGMNFWVAQTGKMGDGWQYTYSANKIRGLKQTHQPSPWINDYGQFSLMATVGKMVFDENERGSWFSHKAETATPYYYKVYLADYDVRAELVPTSRAAIMRFTYPKTDEARVVIDAFDKGSEIEIFPERQMIVGYSTRNSGGVPEGFRNYFVVKFSHPFSEVASVVDGNIHVGSIKSSCNHAGVILSFKTKRGEAVEARVASSFISPEQALQNLREVENKTFCQVKDEGRAAWNKTLGRIEVSDENIDNLRTFYSCLYRSVLFPRSFYEVDSEGNILHYSPYDGKIHSGYMFTDTGFWDTFRSLFPLLNLVYPEMSSKMQEGLANAYRESGFLPEWASPGHRGCMIGNNSASVVADAWMKGNTPKDCAEILWQAVVHGANSVHPEVSSTGRLGYEYYNRLGYVPYDVGINENVARTLEYAYDDWCIYQFGKSLGKSKKELQPFLRRALNYRNVYDKDTRLMRGRLKNGQFQSPFNPLKWGDAFTEGNAWHYTWSVFHDVEGLIRLMGGCESFNQMLDSVFSLPPLFDDSYYGQVIHEIREMQIADMGNYAHGNQPIQHAAYLYCYSSQSWKTQYWVREIMNRLYCPTPDGYCGDEDNGQTSAWYVFSALGFYPVCPASDEYVIGSPLFSKVKVNLANGRHITITSSDNRLRYIDSMTVDGVPYSKNYLKHDKLLEGADIVFNMSETPNRNRGLADEDKPYSLSNFLSH